MLSEFVGKGRALRDKSWVMASDNTLPVLEIRLDWSILCGYTLASTAQKEKLQNTFQRVSCRK